MEILVSPHPPRRSKGQRRKRREGGRACLAVFEPIFPKHSRSKVLHPSKFPSCCLAEMQEFWPLLSKKLSEQKPEQGTGLQLCPSVPSSAIQVPSVAAVESHSLPREGPSGSAPMVLRARGTLSTSGSLDPWFRSAWSHKAPYLSLPRTPRLSSLALRSPWTASNHRRSP